MSTTTAVIIIIIIYSTSMHSIETMTHDIMNAHLLLDAAVRDDDGHVALLAMLHAQLPQGRNDLVGMDQRGHEPVGEGEGQHERLDGFRQLSALERQLIPHLAGGNVECIFGQDGGLARVREFLRLVLQRLRVLRRRRARQQPRHPALTTTAHAGWIVKVDVVQRIIDRVLRFEAQHRLADVLAEALAGGVITRGHLVHVLAALEGADGGLDGQEHARRHAGVEKDGGHDGADDEELLALLRRVARLVHRHFMVVHQHLGGCVTLVWCVGMLCRL
mmetsp:Transcript_12606/g.34731  ORF Transcript_12606/g.34731 Transcript_12606/m.34731 type:complete len:275 (+) Transcript_12606:704-1528(+)